MGLPRFTFPSTVPCMVQVNSGTSLIGSPMGLGKSDLNGEVTILQGAKLYCRIQYGTDQE